MLLRAQLPTTSTQPGFSAATLLPGDVRTARIGRGSVQSEIDRSIRVRLDGTGPFAQRSLVPDSAAAASLLASRGGARFERGFRALVASADGAPGTDNFTSLTLLPDEHASKAIVLLNEAGHRAARLGATPNVPLTRADVHPLTDGEPAAVAFDGARNLDGNVVLMPDTSRAWLASLGLYHQQAGDDVHELAPTERAAAARSAWHAALHEVQHSISPRTTGDTVEATHVIEESVAQLLAPSKVTPALRAAGASAARLVRGRSDSTYASAVDWQPWSRDGLLDKLAANGALRGDGSGDSTDSLFARRYVDGPKLLGTLTRAAGIDRRTTAGQAAATELLQGREASFVPRRIADAIVARAGGSAAQSRALTTAIRATITGRAPHSMVTAAIAALRPTMDGSA